MNITITKDAFGCIVAVGDEEFEQAGTNVREEFLTDCMSAITNRLADIEAEGLGLTDHDGGPPDSDSPTR